MILKDSGFIEKLVTQLDDSFIEELFYAYEPLLKKEITALISMLQKVALQNPSSQIRKKILAALLDALFKTPGTKMIRIVEEINEWFSKQLPGLFSNLR